MYDSASQRICIPESDTIGVRSAARWMIRYLSGKDSSQYDTISVLRSRLQSYTALLQYSVPEDLPYFLSGVNHHTWIIRETSLSCIFTMAKNHNNKGDELLDSLAKNAQWNDIKQKADYFIHRLQKIRNMENQH